MTTRDTQRQLALESHEKDDDIDARLAANDEEEHHQYLLDIEAEDRKIREYEEAERRRAA